MSDLSTFFDSNFFFCVVTLISGLGGSFIGAFSGSFITAKALQRQDHHRLMAEYWAEFSVAYTAFTSENRAPEDRRDLIATLEKLRLFCNLKNDLHFDALIEEALAPHPQIESCQKAYRGIRDAVRESLNTRSIFLKK